MNCTHKYEFYKTTDLYIYKGITKHEKQQQQHETYISCNQSSLIYFDSWSDLLKLLIGGDTDRDSGNDAFVSYTGESLSLADPANHNKGMLIL